MKTVYAGINSKYVHKNLGLWCIKAHVESESDLRMTILEFSVNDNTNNIIRAILEQKPDVVGFAVYIWNAEKVAAAASAVKAYDPEIKVILGGPEICDAAKETDSYPYADHIVTGEGEETTLALLKQLNSGTPPSRIISADKPFDISRAATPYTQDLFDSFRKDNDELSSMIIYYESSRGCPFSCSYCLSGDDNLVRRKPLSKIKYELDLLVTNGAKLIKFVDRTFNCDKRIALEILKLVSAYSGCTFHFEAAADLFTDECLGFISSLCKGQVQFEIGIQSVNDRVLKAVCRKTDVDKALANIARLVSFGNCHVHADLIAGLPGENLGSVRDGINRLMDARPHMLQLGFLKYLKGSRLRRRGKFCFMPTPPYEVLKSDSLTFDEISELKKIEFVLESYYNSGLFRRTFDALLLKDYSGRAYDMLHDFACFLSHRPLLQSVPNRFRYFIDWTASLPCAHDYRRNLRYDMLLQSKQLYFDGCFDSNKDEKVAEDFCIKNGLKKSMVRAESFDDGSKLIVVYDRRDPVTNEFRHIFL